MGNSIPFTTFVNTSFNKGVLPLILSNKLSVLMENWQTYGDFMYEEDE